jgi:hypothetical protein
VLLRITRGFVGFEVFTEVVMKSSVFWVVTEYTVLYSRRQNSSPETLLLTVCVTEDYQKHCCLLRITRNIVEEYCLLICNVM